MKKVISTIIVLTIITTLCVAFVACDPTDGKLKPEISFPASWPENEFTEVVPKLEYGDIKYATNYIGANQYFLVIEEITKEESMSYLDALKEFGYVVKESSEDEYAIMHKLKNKQLKSEVSFRFRKGTNEDGTLANTLEFTIYTNR